MKIAFFEISENEEKYFREELKEHELTFFSNTIQDVENSDYIGSDIICVFINSKVSHDVVSSIENLKLIVTRSTGFNHIDIKTSTEKSIQICNVPSYGEDTVAEYTFALLLSLSRKICESHSRTLKKDFSLDNLTGFDLKDKTIGVMGTGRIGLKVIKIAKGFDMRVKAYDMYKNIEASKDLDFEYVEIEEVLKTSDIITLHIPNTKDTFNFLNKEKLDLCKEGVVILNTSRGELINTKDLISSLREGKVSYAGLDVIENEDKLGLENFPHDELLNMDNVIFTSHNAFNSEEARKRILDETILNIKSFEESGFGKNEIK